jgi:uncharacterized membrane protein YfcA
VVIGLLLLIFAMIEILPGSRRMRASRLWLWSGGVLSGFFGGLSGHQGALRSSFLIQIGLSKEQFIATGILISLLIDITRLPVYLTSLNPAELRAEWIPVVATTLAAFTGALIGRKLLTKMTLRFVQYLVAIAVAIIGILLSVGVV